MFTKYFHPFLSCFIHEQHQSSYSAPPSPSQISSGCTSGHFITSPQPLPSLARRTNSTNSLTLAQLDQRQVASASRGPIAAAVDTHSVASATTFTEERTERQAASFCAAVKSGRVVDTHSPGSITPSTGHTIERQADLLRAALDDGGAVDTHSVGSPTLSAWLQYQTRRATPSQTYEEACAELLQDLSALIDDYTQDETTNEADGTMSTSSSHHVQRTTRRSRGRRECGVCGEESGPLHHFPSRTITSTCQHRSSTCKACLRKWIAAQLDGTSWDRISCPECSEVLQYDDIKFHASPAVFRR